MTLSLYHYPYTTSLIPLPLYTFLYFPFILPLYTPLITLSLYHYPYTTTLILSYTFLYFPILSFYTTPIYSPYKTILVT
ncbi:hypothetical protein B484DRAFT_458990 [Ochromonadaceae sp. CCMP2298]|nr:hypothetical protein B484DRAFT_458990 [Ochromonadaceae sp. CCMP2298]